MRKLITKASQKKKVAARVEAAKQRVERPAISATVAIDGALTGGRDTHIAPYTGDVLRWQGQGWTATAAPPPETMGLAASRTYIEASERWDYWAVHTPPIPFKEEWSVTIIPPTMGAMVRFRVGVREHPQIGVLSCYLDVSDTLGQVGYPYWALYPVGTQGEVLYFRMEEVASLQKAITEELERRTRVHA